jgi:hypothetical protein
MNSKWLRLDFFKQGLCIFLSIISIGFLPILFIYFPPLKIKMTTIECSPDLADYIYVKTIGESQVTHFENELSSEHIIIAEIDCVRYCASSIDSYKLNKIPDVPRNFKRFLKAQHFRNNNHSLLSKERKIMLMHYGLNTMNIPKQSAFEIAIRNFISPFYLFQYFAVIIWFIEDYIFYSILILLISLVSIYLTTIENVSNLNRLKQLAESKNLIDIYELKETDTSLHQNIKKSLN